jgi:hypothetical protein
LDNLVGNLVDNNLLSKQHFQMAGHIQLLANQANQANLANQDSPDSPDS